MEITNQNFESEVIKSDIPVLLDFWQNGAVPAACCPLLLKRLQTIITVRLK